MSSTESAVPESIRPYLNEIAERLWDGRAAVMVGAGFSKNASHEFPDWYQLGELFYQKAHGVKPETSTQKYLNFLRLAEEVQAAIGRPALENMLRSNIPDLTIEPSDLHVKLLELPWVDVFTTNYDTLLERASTKVVTRRYEPVVNKEDIPYAIKPRIVKLHGSFPSERPFIISEEDYRSYPNDFAPFVNTVQQALLENTFCLIGFSGDDPNFLQWIGWIRDNLGRDKTQKIYLVGLFDLSAARLQLLAQRGIIVVDLSCCYGIGKHDHKKALNRFFEYVLSKKPDGLDWPYNPQKMHHDRSAEKNDEIHKITTEWRRQREAYPGWLVLPHTNRTNLWIYTRHWVNYLPDVKSSRPGLDIQYTSEMIWRLERCLMPIFSMIVDLCEKLLEKYWPFNSDSKSAEFQYCAKDDKSQKMPWGDIRRAWLSIALAMLRHYRQEELRREWVRLERRLLAVNEYLSSEQKEFLSYERFLFFLFSMDIASAEQHLVNWRPNDSQPYWVAKRAVALAELGHLRETDEQIRLSLVESRKKSNSDTSSQTYMAVSNEAYQMLLLRYVRDAGNWVLDKAATSEEEEQIKDSFEEEWEVGVQEIETEDQTNNKIKPFKKFSSVKDAWRELYENRFDNRKSEWVQWLRDVRNNERRRELQQQNSRWDELKAFRCDPWNELKLFDLLLTKPSFKSKEVTEKRGFDIGQVSRTHHLSDTDQEALNAYAFLLFCEETGLPFRIGNYALATKTAEASLQRISLYSSFWATATLIRLGDDKAIDRLFNRESVYQFTASYVDALINRYLEALNKFVEDFSTGDAKRNDSYGARFATLLPEIISRLCCKCTTAVKYHVIDFVAWIYASPVKSNYRNVMNLINRLVRSMSEAEQYKLVPTLLNIPFPNDLNVITKDEFVNPFLLLEINHKPECVAEVQIDHCLVDDLIEQAASEDAERRRWAVSSVVKLYELELLSDEQINKFADALWSKTDQHDLPECTDFYNFAFLQFPHPSYIDVKHLFKKYIQITPFPIQDDKKDKGVIITGGDIHLVKEIIGASANNVDIWTADDAVEILHRLCEWWDADKDRLKEKENSPLGFPSVADEFRLRFVRLAEVITEMVGPNLGKDCPNDIKASLARLIEEMHQYGISVLAAEASCLHIFPELKDDVYNKINRALTSNQDKIEKEGLKAIAKLILDSDDAGAFDQEPISMLSQYVTWCSRHSITLALWIIVRILKHKPNNFTSELDVATQRLLDRLLNDTAYDNGDSVFTFDEKLEIRRVSVTVAFNLLSRYKSRCLKPPSVVMAWRETSLSDDEFSEIRNIWENESECASAD